MSDSTKRKEWVLDMTAAPIIPAWTNTHNCAQNGAELQRAIIRGFTDLGDPVYSAAGKEFVFEKEFTFKEHGEFFRGALTMAGLRYTGDFFELLKRYEKIKVTISKYQKVED